MHWQRHKTPWEHFTTEKVFKQNDLNEIDSIFGFNYLMFERDTGGRSWPQLTVAKRLRVKHSYEAWNYNFEYYPLQKFGVRPDFIERMFLKMYPIMRIINPEVDESTRFTISFSQMNRPYDYISHIDHPNKMVSMVVYLDPKDENGTELQETQHGIPSKKVEWKQNSALAFRYNENHWHKYRSKTHERRTIMFYMGNDIPNRYKVN